MKLAKNAVTLVLIAGAAGAGVWAYVDSQNVTERERKMRPSSVFVPWRREDITRVEIAHGDADRLVLERDTKDAGELGWRITAPREDRADSSAVDRLLGALEFASIVRKVEGGGSGFDAPRATGSIRMGSITHTFVLGGSAPTPEGASYLRSGDAVFVVSKDLTKQLLEPGDAYRERTIVPYLSIELSRLEVRAPPAPAIAIERTDEIGFRFADTKTRVSRERVDRIWGALGEMRAEAFLPESAAAEAIAHPSFVIAMTPKDESKPRGELVVGGACPGQPEGVVVVRTQPTRATVCAPRGVKEGLATPRDELVDQRLFQAHADEVAEVVLRASPSGEVLEVARMGHGWHLRAPEDRELSREEAESFDALVSAIVGTEGRDATHVDRAIPLSGRVTLKREDGVEETVDLGLPAGDSVPVVRRADSTAVAVSVEAWRRLRPRATALRGRDAWRTVLVGRTINRIHSTCAGPEQEVRFDGTRWTMTKPEGMSPDGASVNALVDAVTRLRADEWVADSDDGRFGLTALSSHGVVELGCSVELDVVVPGGPRTFTLHLGATHGRSTSRYARTNEDPAVFLAPAGLDGQVTALLVDRHGLSCDRAKVDGVTIARRGGGAVTLRKTGGVLAGKDADKILDALEQLFADRVESIGAPDASWGLAQPELTIDVDVAGGNKRILVGAATADGKARHARLGGGSANFLIESKRLDPFFAAAK